MLRPLAHERMCTRIMADVEKIVLDKSVAPYERIDASEEMLKAGQKELYWAFGVFRFSRHEAPVAFAGVVRAGVDHGRGAERVSHRKPRSGSRHCLADREAHGIEDLEAE